MQTLIDLLEEQVRVRPEAPAYRSKRQGRWQSTSWRSFHDAARAFAAALIERGIGQGARVGILAATREEAVIADYGALLAGLVPVPIYPTLTPDQVAFVLRDCDARALVVDDDARMPAIERDPAFRPLDLVVSLRSSWEPLLTEGRAALAREDRLSARSAAVSSEDAAVILYTSGTTGEPKGAVLTHAAFLFEVSSAFELFGVSAEDEQLLFLPLAHIFGKLLVVAAMRVGAVTAFAQSMLTALDDAEEVRPTFFGSVPRLFEKVHEVALAKAKEAGAVQERIFHWAMAIGDEVARLRRRGAAIPLSLELQRRYADKLVLGKVRARFGGRVRFAISGAAPLDRALFDWFDSLGLLVLEAYGLTESCGALTINRPQAFRFGTVGRPLPGVELRVAEDGEILARGKNIFSGYFRADGPPDARSAIDAEGFLHTGDVGEIDADGYLRITDRKKDLLITAGGKNVAPQRIEARLLRSPYVARAVVLGDRRPHLVALLVLDAEAVRKAGVNRDMAARAAIDDANAGLASFESIKRWRVLERDLTIDDGELTPTFKVRRRVVEERYRREIDALYD